MKRKKERTFWVSFVVRLRQANSKKREKKLCHCRRLLLSFFSIKLCTHIFESIETVLGGSQGLVQDPQQQ
jgi:uncharacterized membrane protein